MDENVEHMISICLEKGTDDPMVNLRRLTSSSIVPMNGPLHHTAVPFALITAYWHADPFFDLKAYLEEASQRADAIPTAACGYYGCCGAAIGAGIFHSVISRTGPLTKGKRWGDGNLLTSAVLSEIGKIGGPRCCKRNTAISVIVSSEMCEKLFNTKIKCSNFKCGRVNDNPDCIGTNCPFHPGKG